MSTSRRIGYLRRHSAIGVVIGTLMILALNPIPECVGCEGPNPWGRDDTIYSRDVHLLGTWLVIASLAAGLVRIERAWLVPIGIVAAHLLTQPLGGVPMWSLLGNEGPVIGILGLSVGLGSLGAGALARVVANGIRRKFAVSPPREIV